MKNPASITMRKNHTPTGDIGWILLVLMTHRAALLFLVSFAFAKVSNLWKKAKKI